MSPWSHPKLSHANMTEERRECFTSSPPHSSPATVTCRVLLVENEGDRTYYKWHNSLPKGGYCLFEFFWQKANPEKENKP